MIFTRPGRSVFNRALHTVFAGGRAGDYSGLILSLAFFFLLLLFGCATPTVKESSQVGPDRPWLAKPAELAILPLPVAPKLKSQAVVSPPPPLTKAVFGCYVEPSQVPGYMVLFEGQRDGSTNWQTLTNYPYPEGGGYLYYTNALSSFTTLLVRESFYLPRPAPEAY